MHLVVWADHVRKMELKPFLRGEWPAEIGGGTNGEHVAQFITTMRIDEAVIVTGNQVGQIVTRIPNRVHLCLTNGGTASEGFLDKTVVPREIKHDLCTIEFRTEIRLKLKN